MWSRSLLAFVQSARPSQCLRALNAVGGSASRSCSSQADEQQPQSNMLLASEWKPIDLAVIKKNVYLPHVATLNRTDASVDAYRQEHRITVSEAAPKPILHFDELQVGDFVAHQLAVRKYRQVTPVQAQGWPIALSGSNMVGIAQTGSGKTLGYMLPAITHIENQSCVKRGDGPIVLVLAPTRELAQQIRAVATEFGDPSLIRSTCLFGGGPRETQINELERGCEIVIATPERLLDLLECGKLNLHRCSYLVLDEADRMLDMGFESQICKIIEQIRPDRQMVMWSTAWPPKVRKFVKKHMGDYIHLTVGSLELAAKPDVAQIVKICAEHEKMDELRQILAKIYKRDKQNEETSKVLIFVRTKKTVDSVNQYITKCGARCVSLHGDKSLRDSTLRDFRENRANILVATDSSARGLHVDGIKYVINFDYPSDSKDYVHRVGRTNTTTYTLFTREDARLAAALIDMMREAKQPVKDDLVALAEKFRRKGLSKQSNNRVFDAKKTKSEWNDGSTC